MITIFRKIRQKLLADLPSSKAGNRVTRYLVYAFGEIFLVVIGILIALSINTWNSGRLENNEELNTLKALKEDIFQSKVNVESTLINQTRVVNYCSILLTALLEENQTLNPDTLGKYIYRGALSYWKVEPTNGTYDALISSGKTGLIKNPKLNRLLAEYATELKYGFEDEVESMELTARLTEKSAVYAPTLGFALLKEFKLIDSEKYYNAKVLDRAKSQLMGDRIFHGILVKKSILENNRLDYHESIFTKLNEILGLIDQELDLKDKF
ncbi:DUF6090 family protein [Algoriphagus hitonicola]|uniref:Uncharacterized protein n=1 Tax=Algoriphagus hitonicola TaxID=435880 RepID=A0A1I2Q3K2_9BACT|nr:DUF6090 family protein [Algoriphagus hitonicola]SFG22500.1 hypothetical protein SAMN04487988_10282 [Algoriphagus hitonicola]